LLPSFLPLRECLPSYLPYSLHSFLSFSPSPPPPPPPPPILTWNRGYIPPNNYSGRRRGPTAEVGFPFYLP
jgi:hypothetical protein